MMHLNESQIFETWAPLIESKTGVNDSYKLNWLSKYCHYHSLNESYSPPGGSFAAIGVAPQGNLGGYMGAVSTPTSTGVYANSQGSGDKFPSLLPLAIQVAARTIGFDIVNVIPMSGPTGVLTYLDYVYAGGNTDTYAKPTVIKLQCASTFPNTSANPGDAYTLGTTASNLQLLFVGFSRIDGQPIFRVDPAQLAAGTAPTIASVASGNLYAGLTAGSGTVTTGTITPALVKALEDHIQGFSGSGDANQDSWFGPFQTGEELGNGMNRGVGETTYYNEMGLKAYTKFIEAKTFQVAASVTTEQIQDLNKQYGIDVVSMVENALVNELSQAINKNILAKAFGLGWLNNNGMYGAEGVTLNATLNPGVTASTSASYIGADGNYYSITVPGFSGFASSTGVAYENQYTVQRRILSKVLAAGNVIAQRGRRGPANFIVTNLQVASAIQDNAQFTAAPITNSINQNNGSLYPVGTIAGMTLYVDPNMKYSDTRVLVGRKGADEEPGLKFMPYMMAESLQTIAEGSMSPKIAVKSRFALVEAGQLPQTQYYTFYLNLSGIQIV